MQDKSEFSRKFEHSNISLLENWMERESRIWKNSEQQRLLSHINHFTLFARQVHVGAIH